MKPDPTPLEAALARQHAHHEARTERTSCLVVAGVVLICYVIAVAARPSANPAMFSGFTLLTALGTGMMLGLYVLVGRGWHAPLVKYLNVTVQVSLVSAVCVIDHLIVGPVFALSSLGPMVYPLVIALTALRLSPGLSVFAGLMSAVQFLGLYALVFRSGPGGGALDAVESLGWGVTWMKTTVLVAVGVAAALASRQFGRNTRQQVASALKNQSLQRLFGRYVSPAVAQAAVAEEGLLQTRRIHAVIVFGDIRGFTSFCGGRSPEEVTGVLNAYFEVACRVVEQEGGMVNKFIGDGFLALFGPFPSGILPEEAAARSARRLMREIPEVLSRHGLRLGLAIGSGEVVAGEIGSRDRCEFTVIGDPVNRTARLEGLNTVLGTTCLVTEEVEAKLSAEFARIPRGEHLLKGLANPVKVYELPE
ncbi:MAG: adenylate/guanylate cyclase domain-containing protein [Candidatus Methylacidiphilales bacterium]|nr:adenylate/guanylate cyclase domain-containing protein [Candidatus Methylacidiphilales bacterium]